MIAYNVQLTDAESDGIASWLLVRTLDQAQRLSIALNDALIGMCEVTDPGTVEYLLGDTQDQETEDYIASVQKRKN